MTQSQKQHRTNPSGKKEKDGRGGARPGAGRPSGEDAPLTIPKRMWLTDAQNEKLEQVAAAAGMSASLWLRRHIEQAQ